MFDWTWRFRRQILSASLLLAISSAIGLAELEISTDNRIFYGPDNPYFRDYLDFEGEFASNDSVLFVVTAPVPVDTAPFPDAIRWLADEAARLDGVIRVDSLANYPHPHNTAGGLVVESLMDWGCTVSSDCREGFTAELRKPQLQNRLVSKDLHATGILATVSIERGSVGKIEALASQIDQLIEKFRKEFPQAEAIATGGVPMMAAFASETSRDLGLLLPVALVVVSILLAMILGSARTASAIVGIALFSITVTLGIAGWIDLTLNNATSVVPLIIFTLVVTSSMHVAVHFCRNFGDVGTAHSSHAAAKAALSSSLVPLSISALTSAVSLCSLWFVDSPPLRELGLLSATGVMIGWSATVLLLPLALATTGRVAQTRLTRTVQSAVNSYSRRIERGQTPSLTGAILLGLLIAGLADLRINEDFVKFFDDSVPFRVQTDRATELLAGPNHIEVVLHNKNGTAFEPDFVAYMVRLTEHLRTQELVVNAHSFSDVMEDVSQAFSSKPVLSINNADELAQLFLVYELSLQVGQSNTDLINFGQDSARISLLLAESTSSEIQQLEKLIYSWHESNGTSFNITVTGENIPVAHLSEMNIRSMITGIFVSLVFSALALGIAFKSARLGIVALLATVVPVVAGFGAWGWMHEEIGLAATAVIALTIGVVVDDAAHYIYRFLDGRQRLSLDPWSSAGYATHRVGTAIVSTSVVLGIGLGLLVLSNFQVNSSFGSVASIIIFTALFFNLVALPSLTVWASNSSSQILEPAT